MRNCRGTYLNNFYIYGEQREVSKSYWNGYRSQNLKGYGPSSHASSSASNGALRHTYTQVGNVNAYMEGIGRKFRWMGEWDTVMEFDRLDKKNKRNGSG
jgi:hypothetical protein